MKTRYITIIFLFFSLVSFSQEIKGIWSGGINVGENKTINFTFTITKEGQSYSTIIDIPTQRIKGIKAQSTNYKRDSLIIDFSNVGMFYKGVFKTNYSEIKGRITEGLNSFVLNLKRDKIKTNNTLNRPQEPIKPYPYLEENVYFENNKDQIRLAGTLTKPFGNKKFPVVILISGSGPQDRDETISKHKPFLILADYLTRKGIAVLRYDDRGFGESKGIHSEATTYDFATDVLSAVKYLKSRNDIDKNAIGLIGHSEGAIIAPLAANKSKDVAFIISLAGTGISGTELSIMQSKTLRPFPVLDEKIYEQAIRRAIEIAKQDKKIPIIKLELKKHYQETIAPILKNLSVPDIEIDRILNSLVAMRTTKWVRYFYEYNPAVEYEKLNIPVLSLNGSLDTQVPAKINQAGLRQALIKGKNKDFKIIELEGLNHLFQNAKTGNMNEYSEIEETFSSKALAILSDWILTRVE
ncbi:hypothetical protein AWE51_02715 [Aquimarina aggregata]|uniref:Serine aminopeptidase S33 domain-containing protein n=1 Tax=Aquimarina aggregata TaxID=1642818 RepID=A0A163CFU1_9FLAO|nr:alpha/beta fold hydrolase [Aquimarina aggregata]KZS42370.1 hypothetical protein AWE51_02715 [Aquimarina aggregata]